MREFGDRGSNTWMMACMIELEARTARIRRGSMTRTRLWRTLDAILVGLFVSSSMAWAADGPLSPEEALGRFKVDEGLAIETVLAEPTITQPVFINFDEHGRLWVMEYRQYPAPAGLTL